MEHSKNFEMVKKYYNTHLSNNDRMWDETRVKNAVKKKWITEEEFSEIIGKTYQ